MMIGFGRCSPLAHLQPSNPRKGFHPCPVVSSVGYSMKPSAAAAVTVKRATTLANSGQSTHRDDGRSKFLEVYDTLKSELLHDPAFDFTNESRRWVHDNICKQFLTKSFEELNKSVESHPSKVLQPIWETLDVIFPRVH